MDEQEKQVPQSEIETLKKELLIWKKNACEMAKELGEYRNKEQEREEKIGSLKKQFGEGIFGFLVGVGLSLLIIGFSIFLLPFYIVFIIYESIKYIILKTDIAKENLMGSLKYLAFIINIYFFFGIVEFKEKEETNAVERGMFAGVSFVVWYMLIQYYDLLPIVMFSS